MECFLKIEPDRLVRLYPRGYYEATLQKGMSSGCSVALLQIQGCFTC